MHKAVSTWTISAEKEFLYTRGARVHGAIISQLLIPIVASEMLLKIIIYKLSVFQALHLKFSPWNLGC